MNILNKYTSKDEMRPVFTKVIRQGDYLYATDAHIIVRKKSNEIVSPSELKIQLDKFFLSICRYSKIDNIISVIEDLPTEIMILDTGKVKKSKCLECDGTGQVEWTYERYEKEDDCPECDGDGKKYESILEEKIIISPNLYITYREKYFNPTLILNILKDFEHITPSISISKDSLLIKYPDYEFVIMPMLEIAYMNIAFDLSQYITTSNS